MTFIDQLRVFAFKNDTGEEIPPFACMVISGATEEDGEIVFSIRKPTQADEDLQEPAAILFNSIQPVPNDEFGVGYRDFPLQALVDQPSAAYAAGTKLGPIFNSWMLGTKGSCFRVICEDLTDPHVVSNTGIYFIEAYHGKTDFHIARATTTITAFAGSTMGTGMAMLKRIDGFSLVDDRSVTIKNPGSVIANNALLGVWRTRNDYVAVELC